ncbi:MAG: hypothetical protein M1827_007019 [Pycnora praestabilis]|nr:MAG: hypothetical protein M1827_007019 [Pycnora praestabilis]
MTEVLSVPLQSEGSSYYSSSSLRRSSSSRSSSFLIGNPSSYTKSPTKTSYSHSEFSSRVPHSVSSSAPSSPRLSNTDYSKTPSYSSTPASSLSLNTKNEEDLDDQIIFPSYDDVGYFDQAEDLEPPPSPRTEDSYTVSPTNSTCTTTNVSGPNSPETSATAEDDTAIRKEPSRHVDYLSHDWEEEDIWSSWRLIVSKRKAYGNSARLENASWRTWTKSKYRLKTVSPETLNWLKDCDVTWLYGPLQTRSDKSLMSNSSPPASQISKSNSFLNKKPILKKRSMSEIMLQRSISASSLVKQAAAAVQAQQNGSPNTRIRDRPVVGRATSDFVTSSFVPTPVSKDTASTYPSISSSGIQSPVTGERRHIHFNDKVEQCIAVDMKEGDDDEDYRFTAIQDDDDDSSDDGVVMMKTSSKARPSNQSSPRSSFSGESKTIAMLPSTTLKCRGDTPDPQEQISKSFSGSWGSGKFSPSPSQETLRPSRPSNNFLLVDDDEDADMSWEPSNASTDGKVSAFAYPHGAYDSYPDANAAEGASGLRRTPSGMFMPYEEDEDDVVAAGLFGKVVDTVNTAKDIAHVIWNVGWRR